MKKKKNKLLRPKGRRILNSGSEKFVFCSLQNNFLIFLKKKKDILILFLILSFAFWLRFYQISELNFFTYDQARDAIFVKRIMVDHQWRLLGTQTSLPGMYLPPFYYYTIAPVLWLFNLNPVGIDFYAATVGVLSVVLVYGVAKQMFGFPAGLVAAAFFSLSPLNVELSRRAWNPNTLPFFILLAFYFLWRYFLKNQGREFLLAMLVYGYCLSLHFGAWTLMPIFLYTWVRAWLKKEKKLFLWGGALVIFFFVSPLLLFELRHDFFLFSQAKIFFFNENHLGLSSGSVGGMFESILSSVLAIFTILYSGRILTGVKAPLEFSGRLKDLFRFSEPISVVAQKPFSLSFQWWGLVLFFLVLGASAWLYKKRPKSSERKTIVLLWVWLLVGVVASKFYAGKFFFFYYLFLFPAPFLLLGPLVKWAWLSKIGRLAVVSITCLVFLFHFKNSTVFEKEWRNFDDLYAVAKVIAKDAPGPMAFNLASDRKEKDRWDRNAVDYQYFVETFFGRRPLDWLPEDYERAEILYLISEKGEIKPLESPIMEVKKFNPSQVLKTWELPKDIIIYKLGK